MPKGLDYSKWDSVELSDDDSDCHPNIERDFWLRIKKEKREKEKEDHAKEVVGLRGAAAEMRAEAERLDAQLAAEADGGAQVALEGRLRELRAAAEAKEVRAAKIVESEQRRDWAVHDKFDYSAVNVKGLQLDAKKKKAGGKTAAADGAGASGGGGGGGSGGQWELVHDPSGAPAAAAGAEEADAAGEGEEEEGGEEGEADAEAEMGAFIQDMERKAQELGMVGNDEDAFDKSYEIIKAHPEVAIKETTDYLLLVGNDLAKKGEEELGRAFVHQSLMMQYCMDLSAGGANGVAQFFTRMNHPEASLRRKARSHFEAELDEYWGKILARARSIARENEAKGKQQEMLESLKPPAE